MASVLKGLLAAVVFYAVSTWLYFMWVGLFMMSDVRGTLALVVPPVLGTVTFVAGFALFRRVLEGMGGSRSVRTGGLLAYGLLAGFTLLMLIMNIDVRH